MFFMINTQQSWVNYWYNELGERLKSVKNVEKVAGVNQAMADLRSAYYWYEKNTSTWSGYIKSFLPWTNQYSLRAIYSQRVIEVKDKLKLLQDNIQKSENASMSVVPIEQKKTQSAPVLTIVYSSPVNCYGYHQRSSIGKAKTHSFKFDYGYGIRCPKIY